MQLINYVSVAFKRSKMKRKKIKYYMIDAMSRVGFAFVYKTDSKFVIALPRWDIFSINISCM